MPWEVTVAVEEQGELAPAAPVELPHADSVPPTARDIIMILARLAINIFPSEAGKFQS